MSIKINTTMQYNGEENSSGRKSDSSTISQFLRASFKQTQKDLIFNSLWFRWDVSHLSLQGIATRFFLTVGLNWAV